MRPKKLALTNFMSYESLDLDFDGMDLVAIVGDNGAGKSTLLQAITYALWGQVRSPSHDDIVRQGCTRCAVSFTFEIQGKEYTVTRRRDVSGRGSSDLEFSTGKTPLTCNTIRQTQAEIDCAVGLSYDVFVASSLVQQGDASRFTSARPGERKELLAEMLGLGYFQELESRARQYSRDLTSDLGLNNIHLEDMQREIDELGDPNEAIDHYETELQAAREDLATLTANESTLRQRLEKVRTLNKEANDLEERIEERASVARGYLDDANALRGEKDELQDLADRAEEIRAAADKHKSAAARLEILAGLEKHQAAVDSARESIGQLQGQLEELCAESNDLGGDAIALSAEIESLDAEIKAAHAHILEIDAIARSSRAEVETHTEFSAEYRTKIEAAEASIEMIADGGTCPLCGSEIDDPAELRAHYQDTIDELRGYLEESAQTIKQQSEIKEKAKWQSLELARKAQSLELKLATKKTEIDIITDQGLPGIERRITNREKEIANLESQTGERLETIDGCGGYDPAEHEKLKTFVRESSNAPTNLTRLEYALERLETLDASIARREEDARSGQEKVAELESKLSAVIEQINTLPHESEIAKALEDTQSEIGLLRKEIEGLVADLATAEQGKERYKSLRKQKEEAVTKIRELKDQIETADLLVKAAGKTGAQALIIEASLPQIEDDANEFLQHMIQGIAVALESQRETKSGSFSETLDIRIQKDGREAPLEILSGGERFRVDLAIRLAIGKTLARKSGTQVRFLALDEGWGSLDNDGISDVVAVVVGLQNFFDLILVISHVPAVAEAIGTMGTMLKASKMGNKSILERV